MTEFFKALSDGTRLKLIMLLKHHGAMCVCDITELLDQPQPTVSRHLNHLKRLGLLSSERKGTWMWYALDKDMPKWCRQVIETVCDTHEDNDIMANIALNQLFSSAPSASVIASGDKT